MLCKCGQACIRVRIRRTRATAWLCTRCGRLTRLDYNTGLRVEVWRPRRYGKPVPRWVAV